MRRAILGAILLLSVGGTPSAWAADDAPAEAGAAPAMIKYNPPRKGMPGLRIGGGTRGEAVAEDDFVAIAPDHAALSAQASPSLCWYQARPTTRQRLLVIDDGQTETPFLEAAIDEPNQGGIQCVSLARFAVALKPGIEYRWFVDVVVDREHRSKDVLSGGALVFAAPEQGLAGRIKDSRGPALAVLLAEHGYWYDAFAAVMAGGKDTPQGPVYHDFLRQLLHQAGLPGVVADEAR